MRPYRVDPRDPDEILADPWLRREDADGDRVITVYDRRA